ncbi:MAG: hypothetical protein N3A69_17845 [Leptospiraceae bacterium]|nr:hypothetical protein [Leptospiraceae bacterium]
MRVTIFFIFIIVGAPLYTEKIYFLNGDVLSGEIWRETKQNTIIVTEHGSYKILSPKISKIDYEGKKRFRIVKKTGEILTAYILESNQKDITFFLNPKDKISKKLEWADVFAIRIIK